MEGSTRRWDINDNSRELLYQSVKASYGSEEVANETLTTLQDQGESLDEAYENVGRIYLLEFVPCFMYIVLCPNNLCYFLI